MRTVKFAALFCCVVLTVAVLASCGRPAYYEPYGEGVDPDTVTTGEFQSRATVSMTAFSVQEMTTTTLATTTTVKLIVPEGYILCPDCKGVREMCTYCNGTDKRHGERLDPDSNVYVKYYADCNMCSKEDPGYSYCATCRNLFLLPE